MKRFLFCVLLVLGICLAVHAQLTYVFGTNGVVDVPLQAQYLGTGFGAVAATEFQFDRFPALQPRVEAGYSYSSLVDMLGEPVPGASPSSVGTVGSRLVATNRAPRRISKAARLSLS